MRKEWETKWELKKNHCEWKKRKEKNIPRNANKKTFFFSNYLKKTRWTEGKINMEPRYKR